MSYGQTQAFPRTGLIHKDGSTGDDGSSGMTLLEWYAGQALAGYLAGHAGIDVAMPSDEDAVRESFDYAEAMCAEAERRQR